MECSEELLAPVHRGQSVQEDHPVHRGHSELPQMALQPETGEQELVSQSAVSIPVDQSELSIPEDEGCLATEACSMETDYSRLSCTESMLQTDSSVAMTTANEEPVGCHVTSCLATEQCPLATEQRAPSSLLPGQVLPSECPPYVDITSPADTPMCRTMGQSEQCTACNKTGLQCSPCNAQSESPVHCGTPLLDPRSPGTHTPAPAGPFCGQSTPSSQTLAPCGQCIPHGIPTPGSLTPGQCTPLLEHKSECFPTGLVAGLPPVVMCGGVGMGLPTVNTSAEKSETSSAILPICRICHMPGEDEEEMLISPCRCAGTLQFIHNTCLQVGAFYLEL